MSPTGIWIELDSPVKSFFPGQLVCGNVVVDTEKSIETTGLKVKFEGKVKVSWSERTSRKDGRSRKFVNVFYTAEEIYFQTEITLLGSSSEQGNIELPSGRSFYPFQYQLPGKLPSSFVSRCGVLSYFMEANLCLPWNRSDATCILPFTVNGVLDLNVEPGVIMPYETRKYKSLYCFCCTSGPVGFLFRLPRRGFVPGEVIDFTVELSNQSSQRIYGMKVTLMQVCQFHAEGNSRMTLRPIRQVQGPEVGPGEIEIWVEKLLKIPPIPPTRLATCKMIDVQYVLKLEMAMPSVSLNLKEDIPIVIGTIPLRDTFTSLSPPTPVITRLYIPDSKPPLFSNARERELKSMPIPAPGRARDVSISSSEPSFLEYPDLPPPSYQEAIMLDKSPEEENRGFAMDEVDNADYVSAEMVDNHLVLSPMGYTASNHFIPQYVTYGSTNSSEEPDYMNVTSL